MATSDDEIPHELECISDFYVLGFQTGERLSNIVRVVCTLITVSIISSWCNKRVIGRFLLFFSHWLSGLLHQLAEVVLAEMVLLCYVKEAQLPFIKAVKFLELVGGNMLAVTNVAICLNLALIVSSHHTMSRVKSVTSPRLILFFLGISVAATVAAVPFWEGVSMTGTLLWSTNSNPAKHSWVMISIFFMELIAGLLMALIFGLLLIFRMPELHQVWRLHRRIKFYIALTVIAIMVDLSIGVGGIFFLMNDDLKTRMIGVTWTCRHVHIALDTLVLYSALGVSSIEIDVLSTRTSDEVAAPKRLGSDAHSRNPSGSYVLPRAGAPTSSVLGSDASPAV